MEQIVKERLVGMGVLLLLGVIFIPLVLDGKTSDLTNTTQENLQLPVPNAVDGVTHEMNFSDGNVRKLNLPVPNKNSDQQVAEVDIKPEKLETTSIPNNGFVKDLPKANNDSEQTSESDRTKVTLQNGSATRTRPIATSEAYLTPSEPLENKSITAGVDSAWVVQIGSFSSQVNAEKQVQDLKTKGFPAFLRRHVSADKKVLFRVRVGPEKERSRAEKLAERLQKLEIKGQIVSDP